MIRINKKDRLGEELINNQGCLMKIIKYNSNRDIFVAFQDEYKAIVHAAYPEFKKGAIKNPYYPSVYSVGIVGVKYPTSINYKNTNEYNAWVNMLRRCFDEELKEYNPTYKDVTCCKEWLLYENFYDWVHSQDNFDKWYYGDKWNVDKDILVKNNKVYSPETCCLVPQNVNKLFIKQTTNRGNLPIGVNKETNKFYARCHNPLINKRERLKLCLTPEEAFLTYKQYKENLIKQIAQIEFDRGNITKRCYDAMMKYKVEITD